MKALYTTAPGRYGLADRPKPMPAPDEVLLKVAVAGLCPNEVRIRGGVLQWIRYPVIPGHQFAGVVEECGREVKYIAPGDRGAVHAYVLCGQCSACRRGPAPHDCDYFHGLGFTLDGGFAEYCVLPARHLFKLPDHVTLDEGALVENLANGVAAVRNARLQPRDRVVVVGGTAIGLSALQVARLSSPSKLVLAGTGAQRLAVGQQLGATHTVGLDQQDVRGELNGILCGKGADAVIVCANTGSALELAMDIVGVRGRIVVEGHFDPTAEVTLSPFRLLVARSVSLQANRGWTTADFTWAVELLSSGSVDVKSVISHTFSLDAWETAFDTFTEDESQALQVLIAP